MANVKFLTGTYAQYKGLATKDANTLYFIEGQLLRAKHLIQTRLRLLILFP